jgi:hypothetical protein
MWRMSKSMRRVAALGLLAAALAVLMFGVAMPIVQRFEGLARSMEDQHRQLAQFTAAAAQEASVRTLEQRRQAEFALGEFVAGESELVVQANLQTTLAGIAQASGVRIRSARKLPDRERAPFKLTGVSIALSTDIESLRKLLHAIETARPYLFVEAASISPLGGGNPAPGAPALLEVRLDVFAALRRREPP